MALSCAWRAATRVGSTSAGPRCNGNLNQLGDIAHRHVRRGRTGGRQCGEQLSTAARTMFVVLLQRGVEPQKRLLFFRGFCSERQAECVQQWSIMNCVNLLRRSRIYTIDGGPSQLYAWLCQYSDA